MLIPWNANWLLVISFHFFEQLVSLCHEEKVVHEITWVEPTSLNSTSCLCHLSKHSSMFVSDHSKAAGWDARQPPLTMGNGLGKWNWSSLILEFKKREFTFSPTISVQMSSQSFLVLSVFLTQGSFYSFPKIYCYSFCIREPYFYCWIASSRLSNGLNPQHLFLPSKEKG